MEYLITMAVFLLVVTYFLMRWSDKLIEKLKEIQPPPALKEQRSGWPLIPEGKTALITSKNSALGEGLTGYVDGYVNDDGTAYALVVINDKFYREPVKAIFEDTPRERRKNPPERPFHRIDLREITTTTGANGYVCL
jgi:hypothetical protein